MNAKDTLKHFYEKKYGTQKWENSSCYATHGDWLIEAMESTSNPPVHNVPEEGLKKFIDFLIESHVIKADTKEDMYCYATEFIEASPPPMGNVPTDSEIGTKFPLMYPCNTMEDIQASLINSSRREGAKWMRDKTTCATSLPTEINEISESIDSLDNLRIKLMGKSENDLERIVYDIQQLLFKAQDKLALSNDNSQSKWIKVEDRLPEATTPLESPPYQLAVVEYENRTYVDKVAFYSKYKTIKEGFYDAEGELVKVILWRPLPKPPL